MKGRNSFLFAVVLSATLLSSQAFAGKMDLPLRMAIAQPVAVKSALTKSITAADGAELIDVLIKSIDPEGTGLAVSGMGGSVRSLTGDILTAYVPLAALAEIEARPEVISIEASKRLRLLMNTARSSSNTNAEAAQAAGYYGAGVVVGAIDSGLDYSRADFQTAGGASRVQYLRFQSVDQSSGTVSITQCAKDYIDSGDCSIPANNDATIGHGTHVTGIAAGSDATYMGVAPLSDIMLVRNDFNDDLTEGGATSGTFSGGVIDGVVEIFKKSDIIDKPAVINISQGTHIGAHDDTSLLEQSLNSAVAGGYASGGKAYGRAIAVAAGNEHIVSAALADAGLGAFEGGIHAAVDVPAGESHAYRVWFLEGSSMDTPFLTVDAWFGAGEAGTCTVAANAYKYSDIFGAAFAAPGAAPLTTVASAVIPDMALSSEASLDDDDGAAQILMSTEPSDANNSKPRALLLFGPSSGGSWDALAVSDAGNSAYFLDVIVRAGSSACTGNIWMEGGSTYVNFMGGINGGAYDVAAGANGGAYAMQDGDNNSTVSIPGTASGVITVGAYLQTKPEVGCPSQSCWTGASATQYDATNINDPNALAAQINGGTVQSRTPFSSIGPVVYTYSGRKPDVLAPGDPIISTLPTGHTVDSALAVGSTHYKSQGTSQASPNAAGIVALLFEKNNTLSAAQAKQALISTATKAASPNDGDGYGNVKADSALASVSADASGYSGTGNLSQADLEDDGGGGGSSGCGGSLVPAAAGAAWADALAIALPILIVALRRRRM